MSPRIIAVLTIALFFRPQPSLAAPWKVVRQAWGVPAPRFFASVDGRYALKVAPIGAAAVAALITLDATGAETELWRRDLPVFPVDALITAQPTPFVVFFDAWGKAGQAHSLAIYGPNGQLVRDFDLEALLGADDIAARVAANANDRWWREGAEATVLGQESPSLRIDFPWGRTVVVDLPTGRTPLLGEIRDTVPWQAMALSPGGEMLATASAKAPLKVWGAASSRLRFALEAAAEEPATLAFAPVGQTLATVGNGVVTLWDTATGQPRAAVFKAVHRVGCLAFSPDAKLLATGMAPGKFQPGDAQAEGEVRLWDAATGAPQITLRWRDAQPARTGQVPGDATTAVAFAPGGATVAGAMWRGVVLWEAATGDVRRTLSTASPVSSVAFSTDGRTLAAGLRDGAVQIFDTSTGNVRATLGDFNGQGTVTFSADGRWLCITSSGNEIRVYDAATFKLRSTLRGHTAFVTSAAIDPESNAIYSASEDGTVKIWRVE